MQRAKWAVYTGRFGREMSQERLQDCLLYIGISLNIHNANYEKDESTLSRYSTQECIAKLTAVKCRTKLDESIEGVPR